MNRQVLRGYTGRWLPVCLASWISWFFRGVDWPNLWYGHVFAGGIIGFLAAVVAERWMAWRQFGKLRRAADIEGTYLAYTFLGDLVNYSNQVGTVVITHEEKNVYKVIHTEKEEIWEGTIYMTSRRDGRIIWTYQKLDGDSPTKKHRFGFKRCQVKNGIGQGGEYRRIVYLVGERPDYGNEYLERQ
jgi:hypothetical protein